MSDKSLEQFVSEVSGTSHLRVEYDFGDGFVRLQTSEAERRQAAQDIKSSEDIVLELLRNARDANAYNIYLATWKEGLRRFITVIDDGDGIPASMHEHIFEPRVTSKLDTSHMDKWGLHGRGMALFSISVNAEESSVADSALGKGTSITIRTNTKRLSERKDQSKFPTFHLTSDNEVLVRGPRNILRTACEFALEERKEVAVYAGSATEIAAALFAYGTATLAPIDRLFCKNPSDLPITKRLAAAGDSDEFAKISKSIGLPISPRSARRIMGGEIEPSQNIIGQIRIEKPASGKRTLKQSAIKASNSKVSIAKQDISQFVEEIADSYEKLARKYYLRPQVQMRARISRGELSISIPLEPDDSAQ